MKKVHYQNVGFPRTGTTWLWNSLISHPDVFKSDIFLHRLKTKQFTSENKEPRFKKWTSEQVEHRIPKDVTPIIEKYQDYDISMAFNTFDFLCTNEEISRIETYTTHVSLSLRNPFEILSNYYAYNRFFWPEDREKHTIEWFLNMFDFSNVVERWMTTFNNKFKILVYDDLVKDHVGYYKDVCEFIGIEPNTINAAKSNSISLYVKDYKELDLTDDQIMILNNHIDKLCELMNRDFTYWKVRQK